MKAGEIIRIIAFSVVGFVLMFYGQPLLYKNRAIPITDVPVNAWLREDYTVAAGIFFAFSVLATVIWYFLAARAKVTGAIDISRWQVVWWLLGLLPMLGIGIALFFFNRSEDALLSLAGFLLFNGLIWLFRLPTATSSPGLLKHIPPGAFLIRRLIG